SRQREGGGAGTWEKRSTPPPWRRAGVRAVPGATRRMRRRALGRRGLRAPQRSAARLLRTPRRDASSRGRAPPSWRRAPRMRGPQTRRPARRISATSARPLLGTEVAYRWAVRSPLVLASLLLVACETTFVAPQLAPEE